VEVDQLKWESSVSVAPTQDREAASIEKRQAAPGKAPANLLYDTLEVDGRITGVPAGDYRAVTATLSDFIAQLRKRPGLEVLDAKLPFDIGPETSLSGDLSGGKAATTPTFKITLGSRVPQ
jgi:hypothetical protein